MKIDFLLVGLNLNIIIQKNSPDKARSLDDALKTKDI